MRNLELITFYRNSHSEKDEKDALKNLSIFSENTFVGVSF